MKKTRLLRITTVPISLVTLLKGQPAFMMEHNIDVLTVSSFGKEVSQLEAAGIKHVSINMTRKITPWRDLVALIKLMQLIRQYKPHIVHTHTPKAGLLGMLASRFCGVPICMHTIAGLVWTESTGMRRWLLKTTERLTYMLATRVYPNSNHQRNFLVNEIGFNPERTKVIGRGSSNGVDAEFYFKENVQAPVISDIRKQNGIATGDLVFCFIGRMVRDKGIGELVAAFTKCKLQQKAWLILVGHREHDLDPLSDQTLQLIHNNPNILEIGFQPDVRPWLALSDVFILPSYREGFPNVVMQAACMSLPCIVTDINGCNEIIQHEKSGLIVPVRDENALRVAMERLASSSELRNNMGTHGRQEVSKNYNQRSVWNELLNEYQYWITQKLS